MQETAGTLLSAAFEVDLSLSQRERLRLLSAVRGNSGFWSRRVKVKGVWLDNRWVVPYNPCLSKRYKAHINVELCSSIGAFKYLFKYVFKGGDRTTAVLDVNGNEVPREINEIADYLDARYVSAPEGIWRIFQFKMHHRKPAVHDFKFIFQISKPSLSATIPIWSPF